MSNYIIDPSIFYWINVLDTVKTVLFVFGAIAICTAIVSVVMWIFDLNEGLDFNNKTYKKTILIAGIVSFIFIVTAIFIPSKLTSVEMLIAKTVTPDNVNWTVQQTKEIVDYIITAIKGVMQ